MKRRKKIFSELYNSQRSYKDLLLSAEKLLVDCKNFGTLQFAIMARISFIGSILLKSLQSKGKFGNDFYDNFINSINTPLTDIQNDVLDLKELSAKQLNVLEPHLSAHSGLLSPSTGIIDSHEYMQSLLWQIQENGGYFVGNSEFKTPMPENVVYAGGYIRFIKSKNQPILTDNKVLVICSRIESGRLKPSFKTHVKHVQHVKSIVEKKQQQPVTKPILQNTENVCPKCGEAMVLRTAKRGDNQGKQFWGCSGFPKCKTVRQISIDPDWLQPTHKRHSFLDF